VTASYADPDGIRHEVIVRRTPTGEWQVRDTCAAQTRVIETLDGRHDGRPQAEAVACDYVDAGRFLPWAGRGAVEAIPEQGGADAHSDHCPRSGPRQPRASGAALPHPAG
jgi:hypothetical protein